MSEPPAAPQPPSPPPTPPAPQRRPWYRRGKVVLVVLVIMLVVFGGFMVTAEWYTARPQFCGTCHIMQPYYQSWSKDTHATEEAEAACVDCHYAPGEHHTLQAKFRGLSQVASYFTGRYGASRPKARVADASCLVSGCHGDMKFMETELAVGTTTPPVRFVHSKHLKEEGKIAAETRQKIEAVRNKLAGNLTAAQMTSLELLARPIEHAEERNKRLTAWVDSQDLSSLSDDVVAYGELLHTEVRVAQLMGLKCASCHQFNTSLSSHFSLSGATCFTCHFINEPFNTNSGRCLLCHEPPAGDIPVHHGEKPGFIEYTATGPEGQGVTMNHLVIIQNNVNCISCHSDLIHGVGTVTRRDCQNCHDQERYLKEFDNLTTAVVTDYHKVHAAEQRARCNDCHQMIEHKLTPVPSPTDTEALLTPVRQDCRFCHPNHHLEQVKLLLGHGGFVQGATGLANPMTGSRANCTACHIKAGVGMKGEEVILGTLESCRGCHGAEYEKLFRSWQESIASRLKEAETTLAEVQQSLSAATQAAGAPSTREAMPDVEALVTRAQQNIHLVATANGIHNKNYALMLLDQALADLDAAAARLKRTATAPAQ